MVSMGAFEKGPMAPETSPMSIVCQLGNSPVAAYCGWYCKASFLNCWYAVKLTPGSQPCAICSHCGVTLVGRLSQGRERHSSVERHDAFFAHNGECRMGGITISRYVEWIGEGV